MHPLAFARFLSLVQRYHNPVCQEHTGAEVIDRDADAHWAVSGFPGNRHQPAHTLGDLVEAGSVAI